MKIRGGQRRGIEAALASALFLGLTPIFGKLMGKWRKFCYRQAYIECGKKFGPLEHVMDWDDLFTPEELEKITTMKWEKYE